jgi:hypothetical protein
VGDGVAFAVVPALVQVAGERVDQVCALLGDGGQVLDAAGIDELAHRGLVQPQLAADRCLGHALSCQFLHGRVVLAQPGHDLLLR